MENNFRNLQSVKKGDIGEEIIHKFLTIRGWNVNSINHNNAVRPHECDGYMTKIENGKFLIKAFEIKTRPKLIKFDAQGLDINKVAKYDLIAEELELIFFFIDENDRTIRCSKYSKMNEVSVQQEQFREIIYPNTSILSKQKIKLYTTNTMQIIGYITEEQQKILKEESRINLKYKV